MWLLTNAETLYVNRSSAVVHGVLSNFAHGVGGGGIAGGGGSGGSQRGGARLSAQVMLEFLQRISKQPFSKQERYNCGKLLSGADPR